MIYKDAKTIVDNLIKVSKNSYDYDVLKALAKASAALQEMSETHEETVMTELEILDCLRDNRTKGIILGFMPEDVQEWCYRNRKSKCLCYYIDGEGWSEPTIVDASLNTAYCLSEEYWETWKKHFSFRGEYKNVF